MVGVAGGDGSQALVAGVAAEHDVSFVCIPAGTRNHFALDLGVDRDDVEGALDAFAAAYERRVDLATVNGRVFVNNVSLGLYARIVQSDDYRDDKMGTAARMLPDLLGNDYDPFDFRVHGPSGVDEAHPDLVLVSNNVYQLSGIGGFGTRARLDEGVLGVIVIDVHDAKDLAELVALETAGRGSSFRGWHEWSDRTVVVESGQAGRGRHRRRGRGARSPGPLRVAAGRAAGAGGAPPPRRVTRRGAWARCGEAGRAACCGWPRAAPDRSLRAPGVTIAPSRARASGPPLPDRPEPGPRIPDDESIHARVIQQRPPGPTRSPAAAATQSRPHRRAGRRRARRRGRGRGRGHRRGVVRRRRHDARRGHGAGRARRDHPVHHHHRRRAEARRAGPRSPATTRCGCGSVATRSPGRSAPRSARSPAPPAWCSPTSTPGCRAGSPTPASSTGPTTPRRRWIDSSPRSSCSSSAPTTTRPPPTATRGRSTTRSTSRRCSPCSAPTAAPSTGWARRSSRTTTWTRAPRR